MQSYNYFNAIACGDGVRLVHSNAQEQVQSTNKRVGKGTHCRRQRVVQALVGVHSIYPEGSPSISGYMDPGDPTILT